MELGEIESFLKMIDKELMMRYKRAGIIKLYRQETGLCFKTMSAIMNGYYKKDNRKLLFGTKVVLENFIKNYTADNIDMSVLEGHQRIELKLV